MLQKDSMKTMSKISTETLCRIVKVMSMDLHPSHAYGYDINMYIKYTLIQDIMKHLSLRYIDTS